MKTPKRDVALVLIFQFTLLHIKVLGKISRSVDEPDIFRNVSELISSKGYPVEEHTVQTADGYELSLQRIAYGKEKGLPHVKKRVVLLLPGICRTSADWVLNFPGQSLGFILADEGYDVWMGNNRGSIYSKKHLKYSTDQPEFWDFSFDEMARFDLPAMIDYVLSVTEEDQLYYIGMSQGCTIAFVLLSEIPKYNEKIRLFVALAPVIKLGHTTMGFLSGLGNTAEYVTNSMKVYELSPSNNFTNKMGLLCQSGAQFLCKYMLASVFGNDRHPLKKTRLGVFIAHSTGTSSKTIYHYRQMINSKQFRKYDYGREGNMEHYNQTTPPEYDLTRITAPVALMWGTNDKLANEEDITSVLESELKTVVLKYQVVDYNHGDFVAAVDAAAVVYDPILSLLSKY